MNFDASNYGNKLIKRAMCSGMNLLLISSFITAPASIVLLPNLSFAAPFPFPEEWMLEILKDLDDKKGELSPRSLAILKDQGKLSYRKLLSIADRINVQATHRRLRFRLGISGHRLARDPSLISVTASVLDAAGDSVRDHSFEDYWNYDLPEPMKNTSLDTMLNESDSLQTF